MLGCPQLVRGSTEGTVLRAGLCSTWEWVFAAGGKGSAVTWVGLQQLVFSSPCLCLSFPQQ